MRIKLYITTFMLSMLSFFCLPLMSEDFNRSTPTFFKGNLNLSNKPLIGQSADVILDLYTLDNDCYDVVIKFRVPEGISIIGDRIFKESSIVKGSLRQYITKIRIDQEGTYAIQASVYFQLSDGRRFAEHFFVYLVTDKINSQVYDKVDFLTPARNGISTMVKSYLAPPETQMPSQEKLRIYGNIKYYDDNLSQEMPIKKVTVQLYEIVSDKRTFIATGATDNDGFYVFDDISLDNSQKTHDIQMNIVFENDILKLVDNANKIYECNAPIIKGISSGSVNCDYCMNESNQYRGLAHIFNTIVSAYDFLIDRLNWSRKKISVKYPYQNDVSYYSYLYKSFKGDIYNECINIAVNRQWVRTSMLHEYGHSVMTALYNYNYYDLPEKTVYLESHTVNSISDKGFAMREGWAEFFEALVDDNASNLTKYIDPNITNIEYNSWWKGDNGVNKQGEVVEGAIASILWDIADTDKSIDESLGVDDDDINGSLEKLWDVVSKYKPNDIIEFWKYWINNNYGQIMELHSIYLNNGVNVSNPYDVNGDSKIDHHDIESLISHFGKKSNGYDINGDGIVNIIDLIMLSKILR